MGIGPVIPPSTTVAPTTTVATGPCPFCPGGLTNPESILPSSNSDTTCEDANFFAMYQSLDPSMCAELQKAEALCCPPALATTAATTTAAATTTEAPVFCIEIYEPVCGFDGITYANECKAGLANVTVAYQGECLEPESSMSYSMSHSMSYAVTVTNPTDAVDTTTAATAVVEPPVQAPTPFPTNAFFETPASISAATSGETSSAMMMGQSAVVVATVVCAVAGVVALV